MSVISEDLECLKYYCKHLGTGGSTIRLARIVRMMYVATIIAIILIVIFVGK